MLHSTELARPLGMVNSHCKTVGENDDNTEELTSQNGVAALPVVTYQTGETVIADRSRTTRLLILKKGAVAIVKEDKEIAKVTEPGAVFGEVSILLDQPNKMDVRALETSQFYIVDAAVLLTLNPIATHVAMVLARQLDNANDLQMNRTFPWIS
jgi:CRP/FNR family transcriptional regulator, cyclic AMP receptor protein